jgi:hypothetical protein
MKATFIATAREGQSVEQLHLATAGRTGHVKATHAATATGQEI